MTQVRGLEETVGGPISLERVLPGRLTIRIGKHSGKDHGSRTADLTPAQARLLAYALLAEGEALGPK